MYNFEIVVKFLFFPIQIAFRHIILDQETQNIWWMDEVHTVEIVWLSQYFYFARDVSGPYLRNPVKTVVSNTQYFSNIKRSVMLRTLIFEILPYYQSRIFLKINKPEPNFKKNHTRLYDVTIEKKNE